MEHPDQWGLSLSVKSRSSLLEGREEGLKSGGCRPLDRPGYHSITLACVTCIEWEGTEVGSQAVLGLSRVDWKVMRQPAASPSRVGLSRQLCGCRPVSESMCSAVKVCSVAHWRARGWCGKSVPWSLLLTWLWAVGEDIEVCGLQSQLQKWDHAQEAQMARVLKLIKPLSRIPRRLGGALACYSLSWSCVVQAIRPGVFPRGPNTSLTVGKDSEARKEKTPPNKFDLSKVPTFPRD